MEKKKLRRKCVHCGNIKEVGNGIEWTACPFDVDINDDHTKMWHCYECSYDCAMEV